MECYKFRNFGHIAKDCRLENSLEEYLKPQIEQTWKKKNTDNCALTLKAQNNKDVWYVDSGFLNAHDWRQKEICISEGEEGWNCILWK